MNKFWVVALETYKKNVKSLSFVMMVLAPFVLILFSLGSGYISTKMNTVNDIAVVSQDQVVREAVLLTMKQDFEISSSITSKEAADEAMREQEIDGYLEVSLENNKLSGDYTGFETLGADKEQQIFEALTTIQLAINTKSLGLSESQVSELLSHPDLSENQVSLKNGQLVDSSKDRKALTLVGFFIVLAMYMIVLLYASITAQEVASEKGTRIMEVILSSTTAAKHFYGKIMGIFLVILTQVFIYLLSGIVGYMLAKDMPMVKSFLSNVSMSELMRGILGYNLLYLLFGVLIYTILSAFTGSLVSKSEDAAKAVTPVTYLIMMASLPTMLLGLSSPNNILIRVFSYVPFFSSFSMPIRIANDNVTTPEILVSLGLLVLAIVLLLKFSAKVYKSTVLIYSDKSMMQVFKDALKLSKS